VAPAEATLRDPLFAEVFALAARAADMTGLARLVFANPLSGAIAVSESTPLDPERKREIERLLTQWWNNPATAALGEHQAARAFARDWWATHATPLSAILDRESVGTPVYLAGSRMGSAAHAVVLCANLGFDTNASWRDAAIFAGDRRRGSTLRAELRRMLEGDLGNDDARRGALWLAGFLGDPTLLDGVRTCWQRVEQKTVILKAAAYAVARTSTDLIRDMEPLLDYWETIDDARDEHNASPRYWATHNIPYLLAETKHPQLLAWVAHVAARRPGLKRVAHEIAIRDFSAEAVPIIIAHYEETERERSEDGERIALWQLMMDRDHGRSDPLPTALAALKGLFLDPGVAPLRRKFAFHLWAPSATVSDLSDLRDIPEPDVFGDSLLTVRLGLADYEAADELVGKLNSRAQIEWWLRYCADLWAHVAVRGAFEACLDRQIEGFAPADPAQIFPGDDVDYTLAGELNQIAPAEVERILVPRWAHVSTRTRYLQAALAADTPQLTRLFTERIATAANPTQAFEHISIRAEGRRERPIRFAALTPFLRYAGPMELTLIAFEADRQSHHAWRVEHVEPLLDEQTREKFGSSDSDWLRRFQRDFQHPHGVEHWLRTLESAGEPPWRAISLLRDWFLASHDSAAFAGYNHAVRVNGSREDVDRLLAECPPGQAENVAFTRYVVHRRTGYLTTAVQSR
jgi:hypothetical protein